MSVSSGVLKIGTRHSDLARWQAETVAARLRALPQSPEIELVFIETEGDDITDVPLHTIEGKAFFTKEIEQALCDVRIDLAVHSLKDLATELPDRLIIGAVLERGDPRDALLTRDGRTLTELPTGAVLATSSLRRRALMARLRPDLRIVDLRGNVPTRVLKLESGDFDAIVLAAAGLQRLGLTELITELFPPEMVLPAVSQGAVAVEVREDDAQTRNQIQALDHPATRSATTAERALLRRLEGGCQVPVGALATVSGDRLSLSAIVCSLAGDQACVDSLSGPAENAERLGSTLGSELLKQGAASILAGIRGAELENA